MTENTITLTDEARRIIKADIRAFKADRVRYAAYVAEFRNAFKAANKSATGDDIKAYATKVRNGLNYQLGKAEKVEKDVDYLALVLQAVSTATDNGVDAAKIRDAVNDAVESMLA